MKQETVIDLTQAYEFVVSGDALSKSIREKINRLTTAVTKYTEELENEIPDVKSAVGLMVAGQDPDELSPGANTIWSTVEKIADYNREVDRLGKFLLLIVPTNKYKLSIEQLESFGL